MSRLASSEARTQRGVVLARARCAAARTALRARSGWARRAGSSTSSRRGLRTSARASITRMRSPTASVTARLVRVPGGARPVQRLARPAPGLVHGGPVAHQRQRHDDRRPARPSPGASLHSPAARSGRAAAGRAAAPASAPGRAPRRRSDPASGDSMPAASRSSVDLPVRREPKMPTCSPSVDLEGDLLEHRESAGAHQGRSC